MDNIKLYYHQLINYFSDTRWDSTNNLVQLLIAAAIGFGLSYLIGAILYPLGIQGAVVGAFLGAILAFWLPKATPDPKSGVYWVQVILFSLGWSVIFSLKLNSVDLWSMFQEGAVLTLLLTIVWFFIFAHAKVQAIIFTNLKAFWDWSQALDQRGQVWLRFASAALLFAIFIATFSYLNYGY